VTPREWLFRLKDYESALIGCNFLDAHQMSPPCFAVNCTFAEDGISAHRGYHRQFAVTANGENVGGARYRPNVDL
jgi:hypothetical protein